MKQVIDKHQTMNLLESDLDRWLLKRDELSQRSDQLKLQKETLLQATEVCVFIHVPVFTLSMHVYSVHVVMYFSAIVSSQSLSDSITIYHTVHVHVCTYFYTCCMYCTFECVILCSLFDFNNFFYFWC